MNTPILLYETEYWGVYLSPDQAYLGRCHINLKRDCKSLSSLKTEEIIDFHQNIVAKLEQVMKKTFNATMFNWTCLMNNAYKENPPNPHVHWHFRPRYNKSIEIEKMIFEDTEFGSHYDRSRKNILSQEQLKIIARMIQF